MDTAIRDLVAAHGEPAVSIVCPLDRARPGNSHDRLELTGLRKEAVRRVRDAYGDDTAGLLDAQIANALDRFDFDHPSSGIAVFAGDAHAVAVPLTHLGEARVTVGERFSLREVLASKNDAGPFLVLVVTRDRARVFSGDAQHLTEIHSDGFPMDVVAPREADTPHRDFPLSEHEEHEAVRFVLRSVVHGLHEASRQTRLRSLVLVATTRELAYLDEFQLGDVTVIGRVHGSHIEAKAAEIAALVAPVVAAHNEARHVAACRAAREALGGSAIADLVAARDAARSGRGDHLVIEEVDPAAAAANGLDSIGDEIINEVIAHGGDVCFVAPGALGDAGPVVLTVRY